VQGCSSSMYIQKMYRDTEVIQGTRKCIGVQGYRMITGIPAYRRSTGLQV